MELSGRRDGRIYLLRNARLTAEWKAVKPSLGSLASRAVDTLIRTQGLGDVYRAYLVALDSGIEFNVCAIPPSVDPGESKGQFDPEYMGRLFTMGHDLAVAGKAWEATPPGWDLLSIEPRRRTPRGRSRGKNRAGQPGRRSGSAPRSERGALRRSEQEARFPPGTGGTLA
jgi:hypothetical protein